MAPVEGNMDMLTRAVLSEARLDADQILAEAREKAEAIRKRAQVEADFQRKEILEKAAQESDRIYGRIIASAQLQSRTEQLEHREKLLNSVFETAEKQISSIQEWKEYPEIAHSLLREAVSHLEAKTVRVLVDETTRQALTKQTVAKISEELQVELQFGETLKIGTGVVVETLDQRLRYDNTLETRLRRMRNSLRPAVYRLMMGENR
jgi:vacuolar-type H+-ATPase subunit E/Vma4